MTEEEREDHIDVLEWAASGWTKRVQIGDAVAADFYLNLAMSEADALLGRIAESGEDDD